METKILTYAGIALLCMSAGAQTKPNESQAPTPTLSTADIVAITSLEEVKQKAQATYQEAMSKEMKIAQEFRQTHPGWHLDERFSPVKDEAEKPKTPDVKK